MDSRQLRYFATIYQKGSLAQAAGELNVAASALSHHLSNLEAELGTKLFVRQPRGLAPTAAGVRLNEHACSILQALQAAGDDIRGATREIAGEVSVGMAHSAVKAIGLNLIKTVLEDHPKLKLSISESLSGSTLLHLLTTEIGLAVVYNPPQNNALRLQPILEERVVCIGRHELIGDTDAPITFDELLDLPIILLRQGLSTRALMNDLNLLKKLEARARLNLNSVTAIAASLCAGLGCTVGTPLFMREHLQTERLHARPLIEPELSRTLYMCELADRPATFAQEWVRSLILQLTYAAIDKGTWEAVPVELPPEIRTVT
ncbi:LysR family transcriptional regulator [Cribrihabitans pelagius]|uniref:LysR family transcriptional regulator n=1 Tax=Cribrihabitans pelagius TaxID=1765746 RepID=UPI003B59C320